MLPASMRLRRRTDFDRTYRRGRSKASAALVLYVRKNGRAEKRIGFSCSKKLGKAVVRNRIKRRLRHIALENQALFPAGHDYIFIVRQNALDFTHDQLAKDMSYLIRGLAK